MTREKMFTEKAAEVAATQSTAAAMGIAAGALTKKVITPPPTMRSGGTAMQVGSAMGSALSNGAGVGGAVAAGAAVVTAKVAAVAAVATVPAPWVLGAAVIGGVGWGLYKLFEDA
jgi:hypothetical protein